MLSSALPKNREASVAHANVPGTLKAECDLHMHIELLINMSVMLRTGPVLKSLPNRLRRPRPRRLTKQLQTRLRGLGWPAVPSRSTCARPRRQCAAAQLPSAHRSH